MSRNAAQEHPGDQEGSKESNLFEPATYWGDPLRALKYPIRDKKMLAALDSMRSL